jgi:hypothetical protein
MRRLLNIAKAFLGRLRRRVERLRPYPALLILVIPLAVVEPLKLTTVLIAGEGHWIASGVVLVFAYLISLFVTHWLFVAVKPKLLTLPWFARTWKRFVQIRDEMWWWIVRSRGPRRAGGFDGHNNT